MPTSFPMSNPWSDNTLQNAASLYANITVPVNDLAAQTLPVTLTWTPALTAATTNPTLGTGSSAIGRYRQLGKQVFAFVRIVFGTSGAAAGSGTYFVSLPVPQEANSAFFLGHALIKAAGSWTQAIAAGTTPGLAAMNFTSVQTGGTLSTVNNATPGVFTNNDEIRLNLSYEAA
jgi:hypothetical protein